MHRVWRVMAVVLLTASAACARDVPGFGRVSFANSCTPAVQEALQTAIARLHAFDGPEDAFRAVAAADPHCAIAWWGAAMTVRGNPLAWAPDARALQAGREDVARARAAGPVTPREAGLIAAMGVYYRDPGEGQVARTAAYEAAMRGVAEAYDDPEVQSFYGLAILEAVDLTDRTFARQLRAGRLLERIWAENPRHPGAPHYLIHAYDYPPLAARALPAARAYAGIAPAAAHAQHMPSHIYSMLGLWQDSIDANRAAAAVHGGGHRPAAWLDAADPHGMDFIAYAHLQLGQDGAVADALAEAEPSGQRSLVMARYLLERGDWAGAAAMPLGTRWPVEAATVRFVRALGAARLGQAAAAARAEAMALHGLRAAVLRGEGDYWAGLVDVYGGAADAWAAFAAGDAETALRLMREAAELDDGREKHILLENKLQPMHELYGDLLLETGRPQEALAAFETSLQSTPNRFNGLLGAARAARALGQTDRARGFYTEAAALVAHASPGRADIVEVRAQAGPQ